MSQLCFYLIFILFSTIFAVKEKATDKRVYNYPRNEGNYRYLKGSNTFLDRYKLTKEYVKFPAYQRNKTDIYHKKTTKLPPSTALTENDSVLRSNFVTNAYFPNHLKVNAVPYYRGTYCGAKLNTSWAQHFQQCCVKHLKCLQLKVTEWVCRGKASGCFDKLDEKRGLKRRRKLVRHT